MFIIDCLLTFTLCLLSLCVIKANHYLQTTLKLTLILPKRRSLVIALKMASSLLHMGTYGGMKGKVYVARTFMRCKN